MIFKCSLDIYGDEHYISWNLLSLLLFYPILSHFSPPYSFIDKVRQTFKYWYMICGEHCNFRQSEWNWTDDRGAGKSSILIFLSSSGILSFEILLTFFTPEPFRGEFNLLFGEFIFLVKIVRGDGDSCLVSLEWITVSKPLEVELSVLAMGVNEDGISPFTSPVLTACALGCLVMVDCKRGVVGCDSSSLLSPISSMKILFNGF